MSENNIGILSTPNGDGANIKIENDKIIINKDLTYSPDENTNIDLISRIDRQGTLINRDQLYWHPKVLEKHKYPNISTNPIIDFNEVHTYIGKCAIKWDNSTLNIPATYSGRSNYDGLIDGYQEVISIKESGYITGNTRYYQKIHRDVGNAGREFFRVIANTNFYPWHEYVILSESNKVIDTSTNRITSWYRKYSDGWIEQGGYFSGNSTLGYQDITFPIAFVNKPVQVFTYGDLTDNWFTNTTTQTVGMYSAAYGAIGITTVTKFRISSYTDGHWYACGY